LAVVAITANPVLRERMALLTLEPAAASPDEMIRLQARDTASWARAIREAGITVE